MSANYDGLTRNSWTGTWSPSGNHPIVLDTEVRGTLQSISGYSGDRLTNITGQRLTEGMIVYVKNTYIVGPITRQGDTYYKYNLLDGESRNNITGAMPNSEQNWTKFTIVIEKLESILNVDATDPIPNSSILQYNDGTSKWKATTDVDGIKLDAGSF
jgi:hypothetical protein